MQENRHDPKVYNQTERLFKYMLGLSTGSEHHDELSRTRLVKLIAQCFRILSKFCDTRYVPADFGKDVMKAFIYLFRESDLTSFTDITLEAYEGIKGTLDSCEQSPPTFTLIGNGCKTCPNVNM